MGRGGVRAWWWGDCQLGDCQLGDDQLDRGRSSRREDDDVRARSSTRGKCGEPRAPQTPPANTITITSKARQTRTSTFEAFTASSFSLSSFASSSAAFSLAMSSSDAFSPRSAPPARTDNDRQRTFASPHVSKTLLVRPTDRVPAVVAGRFVDDTMRRYICTHVNRPTNQPINQWECTRGGKSLEL